MTNSNLKSGGHDETVEIVHEALISNWQRLRKWIESDYQFLMWQEHLKTARYQWEQKKYDEGALLHGALLIEAEYWLEQRENDISQEEQKFIAACVQSRNSELAKQRIQQQLKN